jgi:hypothetical protein
LGLALLAAAPLAGRADETASGAESEVPVPVAEEPSQQPTDAPPDAESLPWRFTFDEPSDFKSAPWRFGLDIIGWLPRVPIEVVDEGIKEKDTMTLHDLLRWMRFYLPLELAVRKGPFGVFASPIVYLAKTTKHIPIHVSLPELTGEEDITVRENVLIMEFGLSYQLGRWDLWDHPDWIIPSPAITVEPFVGGLTLVDKFKIKIRPGPTVRPDITFVTPIIGLNTFWDLTERWNLKISGYYGGFGVYHVRETGNVIGKIGYRFKIGSVPSNVYVGYRYLHLEHDEELDIHADVRGPLVGIGFEF